mgnify:CR=1 FL=1
MQYVNAVFDVMAITVRADSERASECMDGWMNASIMEISVLPSTNDVYCGTMKTVISDFRL